MCAWGFKNPAQEEKSTLYTHPTPHLLAKFTLSFIPNWNVSQWSQSVYPDIFEMACFCPGMAVLLGYSPHLTFLFLKHLAVSWVNGVLFDPVLFALAKPQGPPALSESLAEGPISGSVNWLPELLNVSVLWAPSQMSQAPAVSDRDLSASTYVGLPCKVIIICRLLHRVAMSCGVILSYRDWSCFQSTRKETPVSLILRLKKKKIHVTLRKQDSNKFYHWSMK